MNSISYLDSILTRSLTSSRSGSGANTPANSEDRGESGSGGLGLGGGKQSSHLNRRASDYSISRDREREKRKIAASLGLTSLDGDRGGIGFGDRSFQNEDRKARKSARSSRKSSRTSSARHSEAEELGGKGGNAEDQNNVGENKIGSSKHPKSFSEGYSSDERRPIKRAGSIPAPIRSISSSSSRGWGSLWGFGGFIEDATSYDSYIRRQSVHSLGGRRSRQSASSSGDQGIIGSTGAGLEAGSSTSIRRASTSDADAVLAGFAPDALLSEREREDVVEFEGYDPDYDVNPIPSVPPSTPFPVSGLSSKDGNATAKSSDTVDPNASPNLASGPATTSRLSSLLFGALNPLTDDYFGPQAAQRSTNQRRRASEASEKKRKSERSRKSSHHSRDSQSEASSSGHGHEEQKLGQSVATKSVESEKSSNEKQANLLASPATESVELPTDPPPPYSDVKPSGSSSSSALMSDPSSQVQGLDSGKDSHILIRGARGTFEILKRLILMLILAPYRIYQYGQKAYRNGEVEAQMVQQAPISSEIGSKTRVKRLENNNGFQTLSQAERPSAARHIARRRVSDKWESSRKLSDEGEDEVKDEEEKKITEISGMKKTKKVNELVESDSDSEVVTEDQASERALRKAQREEAQKRDTQNSEVDNAEKKIDSPVIQQRQRASSRLLPNPNPVDPLLAHDRNAKSISERKAAEEEEQKKLAQRSKLGAAGRAGAMVNRGPMSSLIHHSPKVLVLDLDETLIHSTSRSPTWSALADKSKSRMAVTTGGSLLGLEGLGGVLGLRGQVGVRPHQVEVVLDGRSLIYHVYKRPHVDTFLRKVASWYHVVVFTASVQEYADPVIDWLDQGRGLISGRYFRESCTFRNGSYYKNLAYVDSDLSRVCLVDNSPASYMINQANGIPIEGWTHDPNDEALLDLLPVLDSLRFASDVRHILGIRGFSDSSVKALPAMTAAAA